MASPLPLPSFLQAEKSPQPTVVPAPICWMITARGSLHTILEKSGWGCDKNYPDLYVQLWWHPLKSGFRSEIVFFDLPIEKSGPCEKQIPCAGISHHWSSSSTEQLVSEQRSRRGYDLIALLVRCWTRWASLVPTLWCFDNCPFPGISVSLSPCLFLLFSLLLSDPTHFAVNKIWKHIYLPWITPQTIKKIHFSMMECQAEWMYSTINCSTN